MVRSVAGGCLIVVAATSACVNRPAFQGPLPVRNQHPAQLTVFHLPPANAAMLPAGEVTARADAAYSSLFLLGSGNGGTWFMDGEYLRVGLGTRIGLGGGLEVATEIPFAHTTGGFLDSLLIDYHQWFGLPDQDRDVAPKDRYRVDASWGNQVVWSVERDSSELLDVPLWLSAQVLPPGPGRLGVAVRAGVELPTGDQDRGYGSGEVEPGLGVVLDWRTDAIACYATAQHTFAGTPRPAARAGLAFRDVTSLGFGTELPLCDWLHAFAQVEWETSTLRGLGPKVTSREQLLGWAGGRVLLRPDLGLELALGEDLQGLASPDVTIWLGLVWNPLAAGGTGP